MKLLEDSEKSVTGDWEREIRTHGKVWCKFMVLFCFILLCVSSQTQSILIPRTAQQTQEEKLQQKPSFTDQRTTTDRLEGKSWFYL